MSKRLLLLAVGAALMLAPAIAGAVPIGGTGVLGSFSGTFEYNPATMTVDITLNNDSATAGFITGFVFNIPDGVDVTGASLTGTDDDFALLGADDFSGSESGSPNGQFDIGAALGGSYLGGGSPSFGIAMGGSATFHFTLSGTGLGALTAESFLSTLSVPPGSGDGLESFVVRFRGFPGGGSDKVPNGDTPPIPEPGTLSLLGLGLASLAARRRARAKS